MHLPALMNPRAAQANHPLHYLLFPELHQHQMQQAGSETVWQRFNVDVQIKQLSKIYEELIAPDGKE